MQKCTTDLAAEPKEHQQDRMMKGGGGGEGGRVTSKWRGGVTSTGRQISRSIHAKKTTMGGFWSEINGAGC
jgi:hypothetical protein